MSTEKINLIVPPENNLERIDKFLPLALEIDLSRSFIQKLIKNGHILVNGAEVKSNYKVKEDDSIDITIPEPEKMELAPQELPIDIVYEDSDIAVLNKAPGMVVHPGAGNWENTLVNALLFHMKDLSGIGGVERPGIVHRLDKDTAGLIIIAKTDAAHRKLTEEFANRNLHKVYTAVITGRPKKASDIIEKPIGRHPRYRHKMTVLDGGKYAKTEYSIEKMWNSRIGMFTLLKIILHTGRTHQIRVHLSSEGIPIVGDPIYSKKSDKYNVDYLMLSATSIEFDHPITGEKMSFTVPLPEHFQRFIEKLDLLTDEK